MSKIMEKLCFENICRACMKSEGKLRSIFCNSKKQTQNFSEMLKYCVDIEVTENDELPKRICSKCVYNLSSLYQFKQACLKTDEFLHKYLSEQDDTKNDFESIDSANDSKCPSPLEEEEEILEPAKIGCEEVEPSLLCHIDGTKNREVDKIEDSSGCKESKKRMTKPHQCEMCGKFLSCRSNLVQHMRRHTGERPFKCDICGKSFSRSEHVTIHRRIHTGERPHACIVCGKTFIQYAALTCHLRTHTGEKPHVCSLCGKAFTQAVTLTYHMRSHTGETPYTCKICGKGFTHSGNLNIHLRFHNGERPFSCSLCGQRFVTSSHLSVHMKQHTGEKNHQCNVCGKAFVRREHLRDHMVTHTGQKPHCCKMCGKCYSQSSHLSRHMKTHQGATILGV